MYLEAILETHIHIITHVYVHKWVALLSGEVAIINGSHASQNYLHTKVLTSQKIMQRWEENKTP